MSLVLTTCENSNIGRRQFNNPLDLPENYVHCVQSIMDFSCFQPAQLNN